MKNKYSISTCLSVLISDTKNYIEAEMPANVLKRKLESAQNMSTKKQNTGDLF